MRGHEILQEFNIAYNKTPLHPEVYGYLLHLISTNNRNVAQPQNHHEYQVVTRILRGDGAQLSEEEGREIVFLYGPAEAKGQHGKHLTELLHHIGYDDAYIDHLFAQRAKLSLFVAPCESFPKDELLVATWENLCRLGCAIGKCTEEDIVFAREKLPGVSYLEALQRGGKYEQIAQCMHIIAGVKDLFAGDGYSRHPQNPKQRYQIEHVILNCDIASIADAVYLPLPFKRP